MKITKSRLIQIIKEEVQAVVEQTPTNPLDAYGQSLTGGTATIDGERTKLDRLEEPETQAILDIIGYLKEPKTIPVSTAKNAPKGTDLVDQYIKLNNIEGDEAKELYEEVMRILTEIGAAFRREGGIDIGETPWPSFQQDLYDVQNRVKGSGIALSLANNVIQTITDRVEKAGDASQGKYGIGGSLPMKNIKGGLS